MKGDRSVSIAEKLDRQLVHRKRWKSVYFERIGRFDSEEKHGFHDEGRNDVQKKRNTWNHQMIVKERLSVGFTWRQLLPR